MRVLLDTHVLIWLLSEPERISQANRKTIAGRDNVIYFSAVSIWEVAIKFALRRPDFRLPPRELMVDAVNADFTQLAVTAEAAARVADLPFHHRDPFDRLLVAQAIDEDATLLTADKALAAYGPHVSLAA